MSGEHYPVLWIGRTAVVSLPAEIDITDAGQVREDLLSVLNQGAALLIADPLTGIDRLLDIYPSVAASLSASPDSGNATATVDTDGGAA